MVRFMTVAKKPINARVGVRRGSFGMDMAGEGCLGWGEGAIGTGGVCVDLGGLGGGATKRVNVSAASFGVLPTISRC